MSGLELWTAALPDGSVCGFEDISFSPEFEELRDEVDKSASMHGTAQTDWEVVLALSSDLLAAKAKDLWAFCYGCRALYASEKLEGLTSGLEIVADYMRRHWEDLYPSAQRLPRRAAPFLWLISRLEPLLGAEEFPAASQEVYDRFRAVLETLQELLDNHLGETAPSFGPIIRAIPRPKTEEKAAAASAPPSSGQPRAQDAPPSLPAAPSEDGRVSDTALPQLLRTVMEQAQRLALHYHSLDMLDWRVYLLHRTSLWSTINQLPQANQDKMTQLRPLPKDRVMFYTAAVDSKQFAAVLPQLERSAGKAPFWFDGHFLVVRCLEALKAEPPRNAVCEPLKLLLDRFPDLAEYRYHDGTPFASPQTRQWLEGLRKADDTGAEGPALDEAGDKGEARLREALMEANQNGFGAGLALLGRESAGRSRAAVRHAVLQARFCLAAGRPNAAGRLLQAAYEQLEQWDLLDWEPELTAQIISLLNTCGGPLDKRAKETMQKKLHWLHLETALKSIGE